MSGDFKPAGIPVEPAPQRVPGGLFFCDLLPEERGEADESTEARVRLAVEAEAPLPLGRLAWGWCRVSAGIFYYVGTRERLAAAGARVDSPATPVCLPLFEKIHLPCGVVEEELSAALSRGRFADLRDRDLMGRLQGEARLARSLGRLYRALGVVAGSGAIFLVLAGGLTLFNRVRELGQGSRATQAAAVDAKLALLSTLGRAEGGLSRPFETLAALNTSRPAGVVFSKFEIRDGRSVALAGRADSVDAANRFVGALREGGRFGEVTLENLDTSRGRTTFRLKLAASGRPQTGASPAKGAS